jgi:hypothetical protein
MEVKTTYIYDSTPTTTNAAVATNDYWSIMEVNNGEEGGGYWSIMGGMLYIIGR